jgi:hypothetical protein
MHRNWNRPALECFGPILALLVVSPNVPPQESGGALECFGPVLVLRVVPPNVQCHYRSSYSCFALQNCIFRCNKQQDDESPPPAVFAPAACCSKCSCCCSSSNTLPTSKTTRILYSQTDISKAPTKVSFGHLKELGDAYFRRAYRMSNNTF